MVDTNGVWCVYLALSEALQILTQQRLSVCQPSCLEFLIPCKTPPVPYYMLYGTMPVTPLLLQDSMRALGMGPGDLRTHRHRERDMDTGYP